MGSRDRRLEFSPPHTQNSIKIKKVRKYKKSKISTRGLNPSSTNRPTNTKERNRRWHETNSRSFACVLRVKGSAAAKELRSVGEERHLCAHWGAPAGKKVQELKTEMAIEQQNTATMTEWTPQGFEEEMSFQLRVPWLGKPCSRTGISRHFKPHKMH